MNQTSDLKYMKDMWGNIVPVFQGITVDDFGVHTHEYIDFMIDYGFSGKATTAEQEELLQECEEKYGPYNGELD